MLRHLLVPSLVISAYAQAAVADLYVANVTLPSSPTTVSTGNPINGLVANFNRTFSSISQLQIAGTFVGDLWDPGESWFVDSGGQLNPSGPSRTGFGLTHVSPAYLANFLDGVHVFNYSFSGSANLSTLQFIVTGIAVVPEAPSSTLMALAATVAGGVFVGRKVWRTQIAR